MQEYGFLIEFGSMCQAAGYAQDAVNSYMWFIYHTIGVSSDEFGTIAFLDR